MKKAQLQTLNTELTNGIRDYTGMSSEQKCDSINNIADQPGPFGVHDVVNYFIAVEKKQAAIEAAAILQTHAAQGLQIDYRKAQHVALVNAAMNALIADTNTGADEADRAAVLALNPDPLTVGQTLGLPKVKVGHIEAAEAL